MVRGGAGAIQLGEDGLWAMSERKLAGAQSRHFRLSLGQIEVGPGHWRQVVLRSND